MIILRALLAITILYSSLAMASDFAVLGVAMGSLVVAALNIFLGVMAFKATRKKHYRDALPFLVGMLFLVLAGAGLIMDEAAHMSDTDVIGMLAAVITPLVVSLLALPFCKFGQGTSNQ